jgi:hypothetical protein
LEKLMKVHITHITKADFFAAFYAAFQASITENNVRGGFRGSGLVPFDPESVISKLDVVLSTPSPPGTPRTPTLWDPKTPSTTLEATAQSDYIKNRVLNHQNSSPTSIHQAIDQLSRGTQGVIQKVVLMEARIKELEEANSTLSKRRRAKKTRIRNGGTLSTEEAKDLIEQRALKDQLRSEKREKRAQRQGGTRAARRCRRCRELGHTSKNCTKAEETAVESCIEVAN